MRKTISGYAGGTEPNPSYLRMKGYTETVLVEFDPDMISYDQLLDVFWASHDPTDEVFSRQYRNVVFYHSSSQKEQAERSRDRQAERLRRTVYTRIERATDFYPAEDYHQKYYLRRTEKLFEEFRKLFPGEEDFTASTAAARLNGYLGCNGQPEDLQKEIDSLGLSVAGQNYLLEYLTTACNRFDGMTCPAPPAR